MEHRHGFYEQRYDFYRFLHLYIFFIMIQYHAFLRMKAKNAYGYGKMHMGMSAYAGDTSSNL